MVLICFIYFASIIHTIFQGVYPQSPLQEFGNNTKSFILITLSVFQEPVLPFAGNLITPVMVVFLG